MPEDYCFIDKDVKVAKSSKKSPLILPMIVLFIVMIFGLYICFESMKQIWIKSSPWSEKIEMVDQQCNHLGVHFPQPLSYKRGECSCTPVQFFAILSTQRSGSGWFETLLNSHINISSNGEIFSKKDRRSSISSITDTLEKVYNLDWFSSSSKNECTAAVGLKWMLNQGLMEHYEAIANYFNKRRVSIIFLFRRNLLRRLVSMLANSHDRDAKQLNGTHKAHVHSKDEADVLARFKPTIDAKTLIPTLQLMDEWTENALKYFNSTRHIVLYYEDLVANRTRLAEVLEFLEVPKRMLVSQHVKIHIKPMNHQINNWDDVYRVLKGTSYERFIHQPDYDP